MLTEEERKSVFETFCQLKDHEVQNRYLRGCIQKKGSDNIQRRPRTQNSVARNSYIYSVSAKKKTVKVCKAAFLGLHGIKESRLKKKILNFFSDMTDKRGKHDNHRQIADSIRNRIRKHISSFPARESHYSRSKNKHKKYLDSSLSIAEMHRIFLQESPYLANECKYSLYKHIFNYELNITFGYPRTDICDTCEKQQANLATAKANNDPAEAKKIETEHELHIRKADVFNTQLCEVTESALEMNDDCDTAVIAMDFQKNLPLPLTNIGQEYYKRQLWLHNFCIHDNVNNLAWMFLYSENFAAKGPNEVISCLDFFINRLSSKIRKLHIFADNCFSQNKNRYLFSYLYATAHSKLDEIHIYYPIPGHSRMPCDRDFAHIEKKRRKKDKVIKPSEWVRLIENTHLVDPFRIVFVEHPLTDDLKADHTPIVTVKNYKKAFDPLLKAPTGISSLRGMLFRRKHRPSCRYVMTGTCSTAFQLLKRGKRVENLIASISSSRLLRAYHTYLPIKQAKLNDVFQLLQHVFLPEEVTFYSKLRCSQSNSEHDDDVEME